MTSVTVPRRSTRATSMGSARFRSLSAFTDDSLTWRPSVPQLMPRASYVPSVYQRRSLGRYSQRHERYCLRKSFSMGQLDIGFPNSYVHQIYLDAGAQRGARSARKLVRLLKQKFVKRPPERLLRRVHEKKLQRLNRRLIPTLCWQIYFCFIAYSLFRDDGWFQTYVLQKIIDFLFFFRKSNDFLPHTHVIPPGADAVGPSLMQAWSALAKFYIPASVIHMLFVLDHEPKGTDPEVLDFLINVKMDYAAYMEAEEQQKPEETLTLTECFQKPRRWQLLTLVLILTAIYMLISNGILLYTRCNILFVRKPWYEQMESWMNGTMRAYFKERVTYLRESRQMPAQANDIVKLDDMQQSIGCCGMFMFMEWWSIKEQPTFPPDELELFQGSPVDTSMNLSVPFSCCKWHKQVKNTTETAACNHYQARPSEIHPIGCLYFNYYLAVYFWLVLHIALLLLPTLLLLPQLSLYLAAFQPSNFVRQMKGLVKKVEEKTEDVQDLAQDVAERVSRISRSFRRSSRLSRPSRRYTFPSLVKWDLPGENVSNAARSLGDNAENRESSESLPTPPRRVRVVDAVERLSLHEDDRWPFQSPEYRRYAAVRFSNGAAGRASGSHKKLNTSRHRKPSATGVITDSDEEEQLPHRGEEATRYRCHQRPTKPSPRPLDLPSSLRSQMLP